MAQYSSIDKTATGASVSAVLNPESGTVTYTVTTPSGLSTSVTAPASQNPQQSVATLNAIRQQLAAQNGGSQLGLGITGFGDKLNATYVNVSKQAETAQAAAAATNTTVPQAPNPPAPTNNATDPAIPPATAQPSSQIPASTSAESVSPGEDTAAEAAAIQQAQAIADAQAQFDAAAEAAAIQQADAAIQLEQAIADAQAQPSPYGDNITGVDPELAALAAAEAQAIADAQAQPSPYAIDVDPELAALAAAEAQAIADAQAQPSPYGDNATGVDPELAALAAAEAQAIADAQAQPSPYGDNATGEDTAAEAAAIQQALADDAELFGATALNSQAVVGTQLAQRQAVLEAQKKLVNNGDWRVRLSLAAGADYLYNASSPGILGPLAKTGGVIFPYMPKIDVAYRADYDPYSLTHSNYKGYFYKSSYTDAVNLTATFTAQDTSEANYLLAVIHFFRSVTKMFYGQDAQRGAPPPLVYLTGLGEYQFAAHPCVVSSFQYNLPNDVDYIRAGSPNINGTTLLTRRDRQDLPTNPITGAVKRLQNLFSSQGINKGAVPSTEAPRLLIINSPTYVPTKIECTISLLPMQTRAQVSQVFSLKSFANGDLIKGGFW